MGLLFLKMPVWEMQSQPFGLSGLRAPRIWAQDFQVSGGDLGLTLQRRPTPGGVLVQEHLKAGLPASRARFSH